MAAREESGKQTGGRKPRFVSSVQWYDSDEDETSPPKSGFKQYGGKSPLRKGERDWRLEDSDSDYEDGTVTNLKWGEAKGRTKTAARNGFTNVRGASSCSSSSGWRDANSFRSILDEEEPIADMNNNNSNSNSNSSNKGKRMASGTPPRMPAGPPPKSVFANIGSFKEISRANRSDPPTRKDDRYSAVGREGIVDDKKIQDDDDVDSSSSSEQGEEEMGVINDADDDSEDGLERSIEVGDDNDIEDAERTAKALMLSDTEGRRSGRYSETPQRRMSSGRDQTELTHEDMGIIENTTIPFISVSHKAWARREHVQCVIIRHEASLQNFYYPTYELILESCSRTLIVAKKLRMNRTSNYHLFDMTRGTPGTTLNKKSCNYIGKLRGINSSGTEYSIVNNDRMSSELGGICFFRQTVVAHLKEGSVPRKMRVAVPSLDSNNIPVPFDTNLGNLVSKLSAEDKLDGELTFLQSKLPVYHDGNYRLNFRGRVNQASVKNFQLTTEDDIEDIILLFGKVGVNRFHLDFKAPLNSIQAFCLALAQFNL